MMDPDEDIDLEISHVELSKTFSKDKCIFCQKKGKLSSTEVGRKRIRETAELRCDEVVKKRINFTGNDSFSYHSDKCFKPYTHKKSLERLPSPIPSIPDDISDNNEQYSDNTSLLSPKTTRSKLSRRAEPCSSKTDKRYIEKTVKCIICNQISHKKRYEKSRISESNMGQHFLDAVRHINDVVFERIADISDLSRLFAADIYYHVPCMKSYLRIYDNMKNDAMSNRSGRKGNVIERKEAFTKILPQLQEQIELGSGIALSDIRDYLNGKEDAHYTNVHLKQLLIDEFGDDIRFCDSERQNQSEMIFSAKLSPEVLSRKLRSIDVVKESAAMLREELQNTDFQLKDQFKDTSNLSNAWKSTSIPENLIHFFSELFQISQSALFSKDEVECLPDDFLEDNMEDAQQQESEHSGYKALQIFSLFQTMFYIMHNGRRSTPLHLLTGHSIYHKCKGKQLITAMNRIGVSVSYSEVRRTRNQLALYTEQSCVHGKTPLPSHFSTSDFTIGALDNADFKDTSSLSGKCSSHDTVMVLFQNCSVNATKKPKLSETKVDACSRKLKSNLPCQEIKSCSRPHVKSSLPNSFAIKEGQMSIDNDISEANQKHSMLEFLISLVKSGLPNDNFIDTPTWAGIHSLLSTADIPLKRVAFLPVIPYPVTQYATVYTAMKNFQEINAQLQQTILPFFSDEGVFHTVVEILLDHPGEFNDLYAMMGTFHLCKAALHCGGKVLAGSGIDTALKKEGIFGDKTVESVLSGGHYVRSLKGMLIVSIAIRSLQWKAFWLQTDQAKYNNLIENVVDLKDLLLLQKHTHSLQSLVKNVSSDKLAELLKQDFDTFIENICKKSEQCRYLNNFVTIIEAIKNLIAADRDGDWGLHVSAIGQIMPYFSACDSINYLRYASYYFEKIKLLEKEHPELYILFKKGNFVVKSKEGKFNAVAADLKLEQTIQRAQKDPKGIIGQNRKQEYVAQWHIIYHEISQIVSLFYDITQVNHSSSSETYIHHELNNASIKDINNGISKLVNVLTKDGNPFIVADINLHNVLTKEVLFLENKLYILNILELGIEHYMRFRHERFVTKEKKLFERITTLRFKGFKVKDSKQKSAKSVQKSLVKDIADIQQQIDIAKERGVGMKDLLHYDFPTSNLIPLLTNPNKSSILPELENHLTIDDYSYKRKDTHLDSVTLVDFMSVARSTNFGKFEVFGKALDHIYENATSISNSKEIHFVYDSYLQYSIKSGERMKRKNAVEAAGILLNTIVYDTPIPKNMDTFWAESSNKEKLQEFSREYYRRRSQPGIHLVLGGMLYGEHVGNADNIPAICISADGGEDVTTLALQLEEADMRIIPHSIDSVKRGCTRIVVIANDTDVVILMLRYADKLLSEGAQEMWIQLGKLEKQRFIPIHTLCAKLGVTFCRVLLKAYIASGCDWLTHIGSKLASLKADPVKYLEDFGEDSTPSKELLEDLEEYLVKIYKPNAELKTFDELRYNKYQSKVSIVELPPSSYCMARGHMRRLLYLVYTCVHLHDFPEVLNPMDFGWVEEGGMLMQHNEWNLLPEYLTSKCGCELCKSNRCGCKKQAIKCTSYCKCENICENKK